MHEFQRISPLAPRLSALSRTRAGAGELQRDKTGVFVIEDINQLQKFQCR